MQKIFIIGNLTGDPETRTTQSNISVCAFTVAVNRRFPNKDGEKETDYYRISAWRQIGDNCQRYLSKGKKVSVVGELQARMYVSNTGETRMSLDVVADEVEFLSPKSTGGAPNAQGFVQDDNDDLPFG